MKTSLFVQFSCFFFLALIFLNPVLGFEKGKRIFPSDFPFSEKLFSLNSCIVIGDFALPNCSLASPSRFDYPENEFVCSEHSIANLILNNGNQVYFEDFECAIKHCPFSPVLIEIIGTHYLQNRLVIQESTENILVRGYPFTHVTDPNGHSLQNPPLATIVGTVDFQNFPRDLYIAFENVVFDGCQK